MRKPVEFVGHPSPYLAGTFRAVCRYVVDGDTFDVFIDLGFLKYAYETIRLRDFDAPELRSPDPVEKQRAFDAKARVEALVLDKPVLLVPYKDVETFGRFVAAVQWWDGTGWHDLATTLAVEGFAK
jgi:endonuclease YncB( thermonuclease family)